MFNFNRLHAQVGLFDEPQRDQDLGCIPTVLLRFAAALPNKHEIYGGCPKYLFPDSPQSLSQSRSNRGTTVSNRGSVCSSLIRSYT